MDVTTGTHLGVLAIGTNLNFNFNLYFSIVNTPVISEGAESKACFAC